MVKTKKEKLNIIKKRRDVKLFRDLQKLTGNEEVFSLSGKRLTHENIGKRENINQALQLKKLYNKPNANKIYKKVYGEKIKNYQRLKAKDIVNKIGEAPDAFYKILNRQERKNAKAIHRRIKREIEEHNEEIDDELEEKYGDAKFGGYVIITIRFKISEEVVDREIEYHQNERGVHICIAEAERKINKYIGKVNGNAGGIMAYDISANVDFDKTYLLIMHFEAGIWKKEPLEQMRQYRGGRPLFRDEPINAISYIKLPYEIQGNNAIYQYSCVNEYLLSNISKNDYTKKVIEYLEENKNIKWTVGSLIKFHEENNIPYIFYDLYLKTYKKNKKLGTKHFAISRAILSNEHMTPITKKEITALRKLKSDKLEIDNIILDDKLNMKIKNMMTKDQLFYFTTQKSKETDGLEVKSAVLGKTLYTTDELAYKARQLYEKIAGEQIPKQANLKNYDCMFYLCEKFDLFSTFDNFLVKPPSVFNYNYVPDDDIDKCLSIDKNKCYPYLLDKLEFVPKIDASTPLLKYNIDIGYNKYYFYHIKSIKANLKETINIGWCSGYRFKDCDMKNFDIDYYIVPKLIINPFKGLIADMIKENPDISKKIISRFIGCCQCMHDPTENYIKFKNILINECETEILTGNKGYTKLNNGLYAVYEDIEIKKKYKKNMMPLAYYVIDSAVMMIRDKINEIYKIDNEVGIINVHVDSITLKSNKIKQIKKMLKFDKDDFEGWKIIKTKANEYDSENVGEDNNMGNEDKIKLPIRADIGEDLPEINTFVNCLAGTGKTYHIINKIIPKIRSNKDIKDNFLVLSASHKALFEYYLLGDVNARCIQAYELNKELQHKFNYKYIIIDEIGLISTKEWNLIYEMLNKDTIILGFGDVHQLFPVKDDIMPASNKLIQSIIFGNGQYDYFNTNYRNKYKLSDYKRMYEGEYKLKKWETKMFNGEIKEVNICYKNETIDRINEECVKEWKDIIGVKTITTRNKEGNKIRKQVDFKIKVGGKFISVSNDLSYLDIHNNFNFIIKKYNNKTITLKREADEKIIIIEKKLFNSSNFDYGYAITLYRVQGSSIPKNKVAFHDKELILKHPRYLYTALSRLQF